MTMENHEYFKEEDSFQDHHADLKWPDANSHCPDPTGSLCSECNGHGYVKCVPVGRRYTCSSCDCGQDMIHCHRCGWEGKRLDLDVNKGGQACPKCPEHRDIHASLSIMENVELNHE